MSGGIFSVRSDCRFGLGLGGLSAGNVDVFFGFGNVREDRDLLALDLHEPLMDRKDLTLVAIDDLRRAHLEHTDEWHVALQEFDVTATNGTNEHLVGCT